MQEQIQLSCLSNQSSGGNDNPQMFSGFSSATPQTKRRLGIEVDDLGIRTLVRDHYVDFNLQSDAKRHRR
jgi:hypothetical protein